MQQRAFSLFEASGKPASVCVGNLPQKSVSSSQQTSPFTRLFSQAGIFAPLFLLFAKSSAILFASKNRFPISLTSFLRLWQKPYPASKNLSFCNRFLGVD